MGTNFYALHALTDLAAPGTMGEVEIIHLGKLSHGWLPVVPHKNIDQWMDDVCGATLIRDEYGRTYTDGEVIGRFARHAWSKVNRNHDGSPLDAITFMFSMDGGEFS